MARTTIRDVAAAAGVSMKTVSRVINKEPNVRPDKEERVRSAITKLGYRPNRSARSLRSNRSHLISLLYDESTHFYVVTLLEGALAKCDDEGFDFLIRPCNMRSSTFVEQAIEFVDHSRIEGLVLAPPLADHRPLIRELDRRNVPFVRISPYTDHNSPYVASDEFKAAMQVTQHLISLGHQEIGFIMGHPDHGASKWRLDGYRAALKNAGIHARKGLIQKGDFSFELAEKCARRLLSGTQRPTAIFASNDAMAAAVYKVAGQLSLEIPGSLSVVGFDDADIATQLWPPMTTVRQPTFRLANRATRLLIDQIRNHDSENEVALLECEPIVRDSTGPAVNSTAVTSDS